MKKLISILVIIFTSLLITAEAYSLPSCSGSYTSSWNMCMGTWTNWLGAKYVGEFKNGSKFLSATKVQSTSASPILNACSGCELEIEMFKMRKVDKGLYCDNCYPKFKALNQTELSDE